MNRLAGGRLTPTVTIAVKRAATNGVWYDAAATVVTEKFGMIGQTTDSVAVKTNGAKAGAAMRMRRCRARRRAGYQCFMIELHRTEIDTLVRRGLLRAEECKDDGAVVDAVSEHIEQTLGSPQ